MRRSCIVALLAGAACHPATRPAARFEGHSEAPVLTAASLPIVATMPVGYRTMGRMSAQCRPVAVTAPWHGEWLSDVDCSSERLTRVLRERAAAEGAELMAALRCSSRPVRKTASDLHCRAELGRHADSHRRARPTSGASRSSSLLESDASEAWNIHVDFTPTGAESARPPRATAEVQETPEMPANQLALGELVTRCEQACTERGAREGLRAAAARRGANAVSMPTCRAHDEGWLCVGTATVYEFDPRATPGAR